MDKLTIRELATYLPYKVNFISEMDKPYDEYGNQPVWTLNGINEMFGDYCLMFGDYCLLTKENNDAYPINMCKLCLFPLSSITKEIEVNGERFVPFEKLEELMPNAQNYNWLRSGYSHKDLRDTIMEYSVIDKLCEWNFDCFNLIERGFAIDKTTLNP